MPEVTDGGKSQARDRRVLGLIRELVEPAPLEDRPEGQQPDRPIVDILPAGGWNGYRRMVVMLAHGESGRGFVERRGCVGQRSCSGRAVVHDELLERRSDNRRPIRISRGRNGDGLTPAARRHPGIPTGLDDDVS